MIRTGPDHRVVHVRHPGYGSWHARLWKAPIYRGVMMITDRAGGSEEGRGSASRLKEGHMAGDL